MFGLPVTRCIVFEDSFNGLKAGRAAGMKVVGLSTTNAPDQIQALCDSVIPDFRDFYVENCLKCSPGRIIMINFAADFIKNRIMAGYLVEDTRKVTTHRLIEMKQQGKKIAMLTSYDYTMARIVDGAGVDVILVGDSASNVMAGNTTTLPITLNQ